MMGDIDPMNPYNFYTGYNLYKYDENKNKWNYNALTLNPFEYDEDPRNIKNDSCSPYEIPQNVFIRRLGYDPQNQKLYMLQNYMSGNQGAIRIFRFENDSNFAIPSARQAISDGNILSTISTTNKWTRICMA